jgi:hypothetical protein
LLRGSYTKQSQDLQANISGAQLTLAPTVQSAGKKHPGYSCWTGVSFMIERCSCNVKVSSVLAEARDHRLSLKGGSSGANFRTVQDLDACKDGRGAPHSQSTLGSVAARREDSSQ